MTAKYDRDNLTFLYPENWILDEDPPRGIPRSISVAAESGAFWCATVYHNGTSLEDLTDKYLRTLQEEYEDLEQARFEIQFNGKTTAGVELQFYCLDFLVRSRLFGMRVGDRPTLVAWQAEDREFDELELVFHAITISLLQGASS